MMNEQQKCGKKVIYILALIVFVTIVAVMKKPQNTSNYRNSDAVWHTLLILEAYDETPAVIHKFLPLVTLGEDRDKWISWGSAIHDDSGNYYYTSFSALGYVLPYLFMKLCHLEFTEQSLYLFNTTLLLLSCLVITQLFWRIWGEKLKLSVLAVVMVAYILSPEIMHGMGTVYWHQSLMQVFLPLQCLMYYCYIKEGKKRAGIGFLIMCLINPYCEWSGYVANAGYFFAEIVRYRSKAQKGRQLLLMIFLTTLLSMGLFCGHYLLNVESDVFFHVLKARFFVRNMTAAMPWSRLLTGYLESFGALLILTVVAMVTAGILYSREKKILGLNEKLLLFTAAFPILENVIMKQHAVDYSYDRMKLAFPLLLILYGCIYLCKKRKNLTVCILAICLIIVVRFAIPYKTDEIYIWDADYRIANRKLCEYINKYYDDSVCGLNKPVRGYANIAMGRGVYSNIEEPGQLEIQAEKQNCRYIVALYSLDAEGKDRWNMYKLGADVYDRTSGKMISIQNQDYNILISESDS